MEKALAVMDKAANQMRRYQDALLAIQFSDIRALASDARLDLANALVKLDDARRGEYRGVQPTERGE
jgi:hypothetical protein